MISKYSYKNLEWVDLESPTREEILKVLDEHAIPPVVADELSQETFRSKVDLYKNLGFIYLVLHFPVFNEETKEYKDEEIDFVIGRDVLITTHYAEIPPITNFTKIFGLNSDLDKGKVGEHAGFLFFHLLRDLYEYTSEELEFIDKDLREVEDQIFNKKQTEAVEVLSDINHSIVDFRQAMSYHESVLDSFSKSSESIFGPEFSSYMHIINSEHNKIKSSLLTQKDILQDLRNTNDSLLTTKTNETVKVLTIMNFVMLPVMIITGTFGMNVFNNQAFIRGKFEFLLVIGSMVLLGLLTFILFKAKKWL